MVVGFNRLIEHLVAEWTDPVWYQYDLHAVLAVSRVWAPCGVGLVPGTPPGPPGGVRTGPHSPGTSPHAPWRPWQCYNGPSYVSWCSPSDMETFRNWS